MVKTQSTIRPVQQTRKSDETRKLLNLQESMEIKRSRSKSRSMERSESGGNNNNEEPQSPVMVHVPSIDERTKKYQRRTAPKKKSSLTLPGVKTDCSTNEPSD